MIHQHFKLIEVLTAAENIILGLPGKMTLNMDEVIKDIQALVSTSMDLNLDCRTEDLRICPYQRSRLLKS